MHATGIRSRHASSMHACKQLSTPPPARSALCVQPAPPQTHMLQDIVVVGHAKDGSAITFKHPVVQSTFMFLGECLCFIPYFYMRWRRQRCAHLRVCADWLLSIGSLHSTCAPPPSNPQPSPQPAPTSTQPPTPPQGQAPGPCVPPRAPRGEAHAQGAAHHGVRAARAVRRVRHHAHERGAVLHVS